MICLPLILASALPVFAVNVVVFTMAAAFACTALWVFVECIVAIIVHTKEWRKGGPVGRFNEGTKWSNPAAPEIGGGNFLLIIPAYLNNEADILPSTLEHFAKLKYKGGSITVQLVFNCKNIETEAMKSSAYELKRDWHERKVGHCYFEVLHNKFSKSKAENVNFALDRIEYETAPDYIGIFDADHWPIHSSVHQAAQRFREGNVDVIQGQCTVRNAAESLVASIVAVEFIDIYSLGHEGRTKTFGIGVFGGSNGYFRAPLLMDLRMNGQFITEDIDSSFRALRKGAKIQFCDTMLSNELATETLRALIKQRQRWSLGWFEVSIAHFWPCMVSQVETLIGFRRKLCIFLLLFYRELFPYLTFAPIVFIIMIFARAKHVALDYPLLWLSVVMVSMCLAKLCMVGLAVQGPLLQDKHWRACVGMYVLCFVPYQCLLNIIQVSAHWRHFAGKTEWIVTSRGKTGEKAAAQIQAKRAERRPSFTKRYSFLSTIGVRRSSYKTDELNSAVAEAISSLTEQEKSAMYTPTLGSTVTVMLNQEK